MMAKQFTALKQFTKKMLFDGDEAKAYPFSFDTHVEGELINIKASDFYDNFLVNLKSEVDEETFQDILVEGGFEKRDRIVETYLGSDRLTLYYFYKNSENSADRFLFIFSFGEVEPTRFRIYLEGVWKDKRRNFNP